MMTKITFYGHSSFMIQIDEVSLLFDPMIASNPAAAAINVAALQPDYILLSHGHGDHVADVPELLKHGQPVVISNYEIAEWVKKQGAEQAIGLNHGGQYHFDWGTVKYVNAIHTSSMPDGSYGGNPGGFVVKTKYGSFYYAGDTALTYDMKLIPQTCGKQDFCILPIGDHFTMGVDDAIIAADFVECEKVIGMHFNTFPPITIDVEEAKNKFEAKGKQLTCLEIGETITL